MKEELRKAFKAGINYRDNCNCGDCPVDPNFEEWYKNNTTAAPVKTLQECKDEVAKNHGFYDWAVLSTHKDSSYYDDFYDEAAEMYANQPKAPVKVVTDEEIKEHANKTYNQWSESDGLSVYDCMVEMAEWMRKQLTGE